MNYTENYHLPQWVKDDRIMMEDFNGAMSNIETGLSNNRDTAGKSMDGLRRLSYNHLRAIRDLDPAPRQWGMFAQNLGKIVEGVTGPYPSYGYRMIGSWSETPARDAFFGTFKQIQPLRYVRSGTDRSTMLVEFTPKGPGKLSGIVLAGNYTNSYGENNGRFRMTLNNLDTGKTELEVRGNFGLPQGGGTRFHYVEHEIVYHSGCHYQIKVEPMSWDMDGTFNFLLDDRINPTFFNVTDSISTSHTFQTEEDGLGGLFLVSCGVYGQGGKITLKLNGQELPVRRIVEQFEDNNLPVQDRLYLVDGPVPGGSTLTLELSARPDGDLTLYSWGAALV